ncbi:MAG: hypothetical protein K9M98_14815 [Cephaloticoccus sp.]|nr:hypothetical protein [Cephaloticoccus sp.]
MPRLTLFRLLLCASMPGAGVVTASETGEIAIWHQVATYLSQEAMVELSDLPEPRDATGQRERDFCAAVVLLDQQPITEGRLDEVERQLNALLAVSRGDDIGRASRFLLGRIAQIFRGEPDLKRATEFYRGLIAEAADDHWSDLARVKLAMLELYALPGPNPAVRIAAVEALIPGVTERVTLRDLHRLAARGVMFYELDPARALEHLLAADAIGGLRGTPAADQVVQIGNLAWELGRRDLADTYRERLRTDFPRDPRIYHFDRRAAGFPVPVRHKEEHGP